MEGMSKEKQRSSNEIKFTVLCKKERKHESFTGNKS